MPRSLLSAMARSRRGDCPEHGHDGHGGSEPRRAQRQVRSIVAAGVPADQITEQTLAAHLPSRHAPGGSTDPHLGEMRLSGFLLWQMAYAELVFLPDLWPDMTPEKFQDAIEVYRHRSRRFGKVATR